MLVKTNQENKDQSFIVNSICTSMADECNCNHGECSGDKSSHKHENGECIHPDGTKHTIHEKH